MQNVNWFLTLQEGLFRHFRSKKSNLISRNRPGEKCFMTSCPHSQMCISMYDFNFKKQTSKKNQEYKKKAKETKEEKIRSQKNQLKKICRRPGEDFSRHPHFRFSCGSTLTYMVCLYLWLTGRKHIQNSVKHLKGVFLLN